MRPGFGADEKGWDAWLGGHGSNGLVISTQYFNVGSRNKVSVAFLQVKNSGELEPWERLGKVFRHLHSAPTGRVSLCVDGTETVHVSPTLFLFNSQDEPITQKKWGDDFYSLFKDVLIRQENIRVRQWTTRAAIKRPQAHKPARPVQLLGGVNILHAQYNKVEQHTRGHSLRARRCHSCCG